MRMMKSSLSLRKKKMILTLKIMVKMMELQKKNTSSETVIPKSRMLSSSKSMQSRCQLLNLPKPCLRSKSLDTSKISRHITTTTRRTM